MSSTNYAGSYVVKKRTKKRNSVTHHHKYKPKPQVEENSSLTFTDLFMWGVFLTIFAGAFLMYFGNIGGNNNTQLAKSFEHQLMFAVKNAEYEFDTPVTEWDYNLNQKDFFEKYLANYIAHTKTVEKNLEYNDSTTKYLVYLTDYEYVKINKGECMEFTYDANGSSGPNAKGKDQFIYKLCPTKYTNQNSF